MAEDIEGAPGFEVLRQGIEEGVFEPGSVLLPQLFPELGLGVLDEGEEVLGDEPEVAAVVGGVALPSSRPG